MSNVALSVLVALTVALTAYTARIVCNEPRFDTMSSLLSTLRQQGGCVPYAAAVEQPLGAEASARARRAEATIASEQKKRVNKAEPKEPAGPFEDEQADVAQIGGRPLWARVVAELRTEAWPSDLDELAGNSIAKKRIPRAFYNTPVDPLTGMSERLEQETDAFWTTELEFFAHDTSEVLYRSADIANLSLPTTPSPIEQKKMMTREMFIRATMEPSRVYLSETRIQDPTRFILGSVNQFRVHRDEKNNGSNFTNDTVIYSLALESPGSSIAAIQSQTHLFLLQKAGKRTVFLFPPEQSINLEVYPRFIPRRRQSTLDIRTRDAKNKKRIPCLSLTLEPGNVLYIPPFWSYATHVMDQPERKGDDFSITLGVFSGSMEQDFMDYAQGNLKFNDVLNMVQRLPDIPKQHANMTEHAQGAAAFVVISLLEELNIVPIDWMTSLMERIDSAIPGMVSTSSQYQCNGVSSMEFLEPKARSLLHGFAANLADGKRVLADMYKDLGVDPRYGDIRKRSKGVWQTFGSEWIEMVSFIMSDGDPYGFLRCILNHINKRF